MVGHTMWAIVNTQIEARLRQGNLDKVGGNWPKCDLRYCDLRYHQFSLLGKVWNIILHVTTNISSTGFHSLKVGLYQLWQWGHFALHAEYQNIYFLKKEYIRKIQCHLSLARIIFKEWYCILWTSSPRSIQKVKYIDYNPNFRFQHFVIWKWTT